jgi:hypothetical protein
MKRRIASLSLKETYGRRLAIPENEVTAYKPPTCHFLPIFFHIL